jgi:hypothetical protein
MIAHNVTLAIIQVRLIVNLAILLVHIVIYVLMRINALTVTLNILVSFAKLVR